MQGTMRITRGQDRIFGIENLTIQFAAGQVQLSFRVPCNTGIHGHLARPVDETGALNNLALATFARNQ